MLRLIKNNKERIGSALMLIGFIWLLSIAGADDYNTINHVATPLIYLIGKTLVGFLIIGAGARISKGGK